MAQLRRGHSAQSGDDQREEFRDHGRPRRPGKGAPDQRLSEPTWNATFPRRVDHAPFPLCGTAPAGVARRYRGALGVGGPCVPGGERGQQLCGRAVPEPTDHRSPVLDVRPHQGLGQGLQLRGDDAAGEAAVAAGDVQVVQAAARTAEIPRPPRSPAVGALPGRAAAARARRARRAPPRGSHRPPGQPLERPPAREHAIPAGLTGQPMYVHGARASWAGGAAGARPPRSHRALHQAAKPRSRALPDRSSGTSAEAGRPF